MLFEALGFLTLQRLGYSLNARTGKENPDEYGLYLDGNGNYRYTKNGRRAIETYDDSGWHIIKYVGGVYGTEIEVSCKADIKDLFDEWEKYKTEMNL